MNRNKIITSICLVALIFIAQNSFAHPEESRVSVELENAGPVKAGKISISFQMIDLVKKTLVTDKDLNIANEKKLHFFIYDPALVEFRHIHPEFVKSLWQTDVQLDRNGNYWLWAQGELSVDKTEFTSGVQLKVTDGTPENPTPPKLGDVRAGTDGTSKATLSSDKLVAKQMVMLTLTFSRTDGTKPVITPYLGALAHVVTVPEDGDSLVHTHPMSMGSSTTKLMLHTTFPEAGDYRMWVQFLDNNILRVIPVSVTVNP